MAIYTKPGLGWRGVLRKTTLDEGAKVKTGAGRGGVFLGKSVGFRVREIYL